MSKLKTLVVVAGLMSALTTVAAQAQGWPGSNYPNPVSSSDDDCDAMLGHMRRVTAQRIASIQPGQRVALIPVCEMESETVSKDYSDLFRGGNVDGLRPQIARNATLMTALAAKGYDHYDVISLREGGNESIILYVHQRHMR
ncbi:hypothetical protein VE25_11720 [Devosia geojensis]|uniref:Uncharacterized protein n=1 Tax=Devosia geojensis TaxID=443610 RepID=A0A0F5FS04_9HYPH|nr:hypothetical protein [Devosia geojensis]KKB11649.1 hypothetical protein VE25_11720 [Devosia geojensis]